MRIVQPAIPFPRLKAGGPSIVYEGDALEILRRIPGRAARMSVTSPPYWGLRDYGIEGQLGSEERVAEYVARLVCIFRQLRRVLADDGTLWLNIGDCYTSGGRTWRAPDKKNPARAMDYRAPTPEGLKPKDLVGVPWRVAMALQDDGWYLRSDIIWSKPNALPESVKDRPTQAHEYLFLFSKSEQYFYDYEAVRERGANGKLRNRRTVWSVPTEAYPEAHFATYPPALITPCVLAGSEERDAVIDPFFGAGTTGLVAAENGRRFIGIELVSEYIDMARRRLAERGIFFDVYRQP
ncbi:MAG: site-specific DNA-methyltransferase [Armatimonadota bacterium]|nr:site-specific DNA-methyltransferase [Armatimonadota bacterium]